MYRAAKDMGHDNKGRLVIFGRELIGPHTGKIKTQRDRFYFALANQNIISYLASCDSKSEHLNSTFHWLISYADYHARLITSLHAPPTLLSPHCAACRCARREQEQCRDKSGSRGQRADKQRAESREQREGRFK